MHDLLLLDWVQHDVSLGARLWPLMPAIIGAAASERGSTWAERVVLFLVVGGVLWGLGWLVERFVRGPAEPPSGAALLIVLLLAGCTTVTLPRAEWMMKNWYDIRPLNAQTTEQTERDVQDCRATAEETQMIHPLLLYDYSFAHFRAQRRFVRCLEGLGYQADSKPPAR